MSGTLSEAEISVIMAALDSYAEHHLTRAVATSVVLTLVVPEPSALEVRTKVASIVTEAKQQDDANADMITLIKAKLIRMRQDLQAETPEETGRRL